MRRTARPAAQRLRREDETASSRPFHRADRRANRQKTECPALHLCASDFMRLFRDLGPSLALWRGAEIAALRQHEYAHPILDLGCGDGFVTSMVVGKVEVGCDPFRKALKRAYATGVYGRLHCAPVEELPGIERPVATVISNSVLEHVDNLDPMLSSVSSLLRTGGCFVFTAPSDSFSRWLTFPSQRYRGWRNARLGHLNLLSPAQWSERLKPVGLDVESVLPYLRRSLVAVWDIVDLLEQIWLARRRLVGLLWKRLPLEAVRRLARAASRLDLSSRSIGGGQMIVARKRLLSWVSQRWPGWASDRPIRRTVRRVARCPRTNAIAPDTLEY